MAMPSGRWIEIRTPKRGESVLAMPTPMNSIARIIAAISQCRSRDVAAKGTAAVGSAWLTICRRIARLAALLHWAAFHVPARHAA